MSQALRAILIAALLVVAAPFAIYVYEERNMVPISHIHHVKLDFKVLTEAIEAFRRRHGRVPQSYEELRLDQFPDSKKVADPWGRPYRYEARDDLLGYTLETYGKDLEPGGRGECTDMQLHTDFSRVVREIHDGLCDT